MHCFGSGDLLMFRYDERKKEKQDPILLFFRCCSLNPGHSWQPEHMNAKILFYLSGYH